MKRVKGKLMDQLQPLRDSIGFLAGSPVPRSERPGECFEAPEVPLAAARKRSTRRSLLTILFASVMLRLRVAP